MISARHIDGTGPHHTRGSRGPASVNFRSRLVRGVTLIELLVVVAMLVALSAIVIPTYQGYMDDVHLSNVRKDMALISVHLERFRTDNGGSLPDSLAETPASHLRDPWGNPYQFLNIEDADGPGLGNLRKDKNLVPLNTDYDLYSMGRDGESKPPLTAAASHDDIVRANNGAYIGPASEY
jgi:general secretion pathway protein G